MTDKEKIKEMTKGYKLCPPCEMFGGYVDSKGNLCGEVGCIQGIDCTTCSITNDLAKVLLKNGCLDKAIIAKDILSSLYNETYEVNIYANKKFREDIINAITPLINSITDKIKRLAEEYEVEI